MKKQFKIFALIFAIWLAFFNPVNISLIYAQEDSPSPSPTDTPTATPDQSLTTGDSTSGADSTTGSNVSDISATPTATPEDVTTPSPDATPDPDATDSATPTPDPDATDSAALVDPDVTPTPTPSDISVDQSGTTSSDTTSSADTGNNTQTSSESASMTTGDAGSAANSITVSNLSEVDSNLVTTIQNILTSSSGDVDLYSLLEQAIAANPNSVPGNTNITVNQNADVTSNTGSQANTGNNTQDPQTATMSTGGAVALANAITAANLNLVGSNTMIAIINILADWNGNIILPDGTQLSLSQLNSGGANVNANQTADVTSNTNSSANTGNNTQTATGTANMTTGNSSSAANSGTYTNIVEIGNGLGFLIINISGTWTGSLINWTAPGSSQTFTPGSYDLMAEYGTSGAGVAGTTNVTSNQTANVNTNVSANANTGGNSQTGKNTFLTTGNALSLANNFTLANFTEVGGGLFFGIINIFGHWTGNIYSGPKPPDPTPAPVAADVSSNNSSNPPADTRTPDLHVDVWDNVGAFVYPGDTVLAKITVTNNSPFPARNVQVTGNVTNDGDATNIPVDLTLGDLKVNGHATISFNINLKPDAVGGLYHLKAQATGQSDSGDTATSNLAQINFWVNGKTASQSPNLVVPPILGGTTGSGGPGIPEVLGASSGKAPLNVNAMLPFVLPTLAALYLFVILGRRRLNSEPLVSPAIVQFFRKRRVAFAGGLFVLLAAIGIFIRKNL